MNASSVVPDGARGLRGAPAYQLFMLALCVFALIAVVAQNLFKLDPEIERLLHWTDDAICIAFLIDFGISMRRAPDKWRYFVTWGWLDLLSAIPTFDVARWGRLARIARLARVFRGLRATRLLTKAVLRERSKSTSFAAALLAFLLIICCSTAILYVEDHPGSNIKTAGDALWWSFTTITTVGYGDTFPRTMEGRFIAALLMTAGVGVFGAFSAALAAWFLKPEDDETEQELSALRKEIAELKEMVGSLRNFAGPGASNEQP